MSLFRDISTLTFAGGDLKGCQQVQVEDASDDMQHSSCASDAIDYRGITKQRFNCTVELAAGDTYIRDVFGASFSGAISDVRSAELAEISEVMDDDSDADGWITWIGVTKRSVEASLSSRDLAVVGGKANGTVATLTIKAKIGSLTSGTVTTGSGSETVFTAASMELLNKPMTAEHAALAEGQMNFGATAGVKVFSGGELASTHPGDTGALVFTSDSATGGAATTFTISNCVIIEKRLTLAQGEMGKWSLTIQAYSSDGSTTPLAIT